DGPYLSDLRKDGRRSKGWWRAKRDALASPVGAFDVTVVGGGPAGAAAAIQCRRVGLTVAIIERDAVSRVRPGESLPPGVEPLLRQLGIGELDWPRFDGYQVEDGASSRFRSFGGDVGGAWRGFHAWRKDFDSQLLHAATRAGAVAIRGTRAMRPL